MVFPGLQQSQVQEPGVLTANSGLVLPCPAQLHKCDEGTADLGAFRSHGEKPGSLLPQEATLCLSPWKSHGKQSRSASRH